MDDSSPDADLLQQYRNGSQPAFAELVARHVDWVHAAATRRLGGDRHRAHDVTQAVFLALAKHGPTDPPTNPAREAAMTAWMFRVMTRAAANVVRSESRRRKHEAAAALRRADGPSQDVWADVAPRLDELVARLSARDREAILLRFYQRRSHDAVGAAMGLKAEGARKRLSRAVAKLRDAFTREGVTMPAAAVFGDVLTANAASPAPAGVAAAITAGNANASAIAIANAAARSTEWPLTAYALAGVGVIFLGVVVIVFQLRDRLDVVAGVPTTAPAVIPEVEPVTRPATITLDELIAGIQRNETAFTNVHIKNFRSTAWQREPGETEWKQTPRNARGSAWYAAGPEGKTRIDFTENVMKWENGAAPFVDVVSSHSWDGIEGRTVHGVTRHSGRTLTDRTAMVSNQPPPDASAAAWWMTCRTGIGYSTQFLAPGSIMNHAEPAEPLSKRFAKFTRMGKSPTLAMQRVNGFDTVRAEWAYARSTFIYWFAPDRGFALVRRVEVLIVPNQRREEVLDVFEVREVVPGVWFPTRASMTFSPQIGGRGDGRYDYEAERVVVDDANLPADTFRIPIPAGWIVGDTRGKTRRDYVGFKDGSEHELRPGEPIPLERKPSPTDGGL